MKLPKVGDKITAVVKAGDKVYVFSRDWHFVLARENDEGEIAKRRVDDVFALAAGLEAAEKQLVKFHEDAAYTAKVVEAAATGAIDAWEARAMAAEKRAAELARDLKNAEPCARCGCGRWWHPEDDACGAGPPCECEGYVARD